MKSDFSLWLRAVRPFAFPASIVPLVLGSAMAPVIFPGIQFRWILFFLTVTAGVLVHAGCNLINDYFDFKNGVDREGTLGSSGILQEKLMTPEQLIRGAVVILGIATVLGIIILFFVSHSEVVFLLALLGLLSSIFYTAAPFNLKYLALGDLQVFLSMGVLMTFGACFVQADQFSWKAIFYSLPVGFLVDAILHGNNLRDIKADSEIKIKTLAMLLGDTRSVSFYKLLVYTAYLIIPLLIILSGLPLLALLVFLSFPLARKIIAGFSEKEAGKKKKFLLTIDKQTAQLHLFFGILYILAFVLHNIFFI